MSILLLGPWYLKWLRLVFALHIRLFSVKKIITINLFSHAQVVLDETCEEMQCGLS